MPISYSKLLKIFAEKGITSYTVTKKDKIIGQATWKKIQDGGDPSPTKCKKYKYLIGRKSICQAKSEM